MLTKCLNGKWKLYIISPENRDITTPKQLENSLYVPINANVPGNVELDMIEAQILPQDIFMGLNIKQAEKFELYDWWYCLDFVPDKEFLNRSCYLRFEGVDTIAEYWLNNKLIGQSDNMLISHIFDVDDILVPEKENRLYVHIKSSVISANEMDYDIHNIYSHPQPNNDGIGLRKAVHSFGWDIMPRAVSAGIWKNVSLVAKEEFLIKQLFCNTISANENEAILRFCWELEIPNLFLKDDIYIEICGDCGESKFNFSEKVYFKLGKNEIKISKPLLWFPYGYGEPYLYDVKVKVYHEGIVVASEVLKIGIRTVTLERTETTDGIHGKFCFYINNVPIMCKGSNWVPLDVYHSRDISRLDRALELVKDIGCNILRCWGGNVYESEEFYQWCDKNGVMIWQDFSMACGGYSQTDSFKNKLEKEIVDVIRRLRNHPCIILWAGDNECDAVMSEFGTNPMNNTLTRELIPKCLYSNDISRPYLPSSPCYSEETFYNNKFDILSEYHLWGIRDYYKSDYYAKSKAHFVSETGYHGCPSKASLVKFIDETALWPTDNEQWNLHSSDQRNKNTRIQLMWNQIEELFGFVPDNLDDFVLASQFSQAEAKKFFVERVRCHKPIKTGVIWWNLLDGWPQISDAVVDYYFNKKIAYDYIKNSQQPFCMFFNEIQNSMCELVACNDTLMKMQGKYCVKKGMEQKVVCEGEFELSENSILSLEKIPVLYSEKEFFIIEWEIGEEKFSNHYLAGFPPFDYKWYGEFYEQHIRSKY